MRLSMIVAVGENGEIGRGGKLPWPRLKKDMAWFFSMTAGKVVITGRKTYESLPSKPLAGRRTVLLSRDEDAAYGLIRQLDAGQRHLVDVGNSVDHAIAVAERINEQELDEDEAVVIGGGEVYRAFLPRADTIYLTKVGASYPDADTFFPYSLPVKEWDWQPAHDRWFTDAASGTRFGFYIYRRKAATHVE